MSWSFGPLPYRHWEDTASNLSVSAEGHFAPLTDADQLAPEFRDFLEIYDRIRAGRRAPARTDDLPSHFRRHLGWICLIERTGDGDFRYRLVGTHIVELAGRDATGRAFKDIYAAPDAEKMHLACEAVLGDWRSVRSVFNLRAPTRSFIRVAGVAVPLSQDQRSADTVLARYIPQP